MDILRPAPEYFDDYLAACRESFDHSITGWMPVSPDRFASWKEYAPQMFQALETGVGLPAGVPRIITYWCIQNGQFIGEIQLRPYIGDDEARTIGHIGYAVRHSCWGRGYGAQVLLAAVDKLRGYGVSPIYIACHTSNAASNRVAVKTGFAFAEKTFDPESGEEQNLYRLDTKKDF